MRSNVAVLWILCATMHHTLCSQPATPAHCCKDRAFNTAALPSAATADGNRTYTLCSRAA
jgi:hypothetical protein